MPLWAGTFTGKMTQLQAAGRGTLHKQEINMDTIAKLNHLAELQAQKEIKRLDKQAVIDRILMPEIKQALAEVEAEFNTEALDAEISATESEIKADALACGSTFKGAALMAVYNRPRVTWDNKGLDGYMVAHPEISAFRREGEPSVTIRRV